MIFFADASLRRFAADFFFHFRQAASLSPLISPSFDAAFADARCAMITMTLDATYDADIPLFSALLTP